MRWAQSLWALIRGAKRVEWIALAIALAIVSLLALGGAFSSSGDGGMEARLGALLSAVEGAGRVRVLIGEGGVLIVAQGGDDLGVCIRLARAAQTLLGVEANQIEVLKAG